MYLISVIDFEIIKKDILGILLCLFVILAPFVAFPLSVYFYLVFSLQMLTIYLLSHSHTSQLSVRQGQAMAKITYLVQDLKINFIFPRSIFVSYQTYLLIEFQALKSLKLKVISRRSRTNLWVEMKAQRS